MGQKLVVGSPINRGLRNDRTAFVIDNDSFPTLINAYQWRGRVKRKRGTRFLCRLQRFFNSTISTYNTGSSTIVLGNDGSGNGTANLLTGFTSLQTNSSIVIGSVTINDITNGATYTDPDGNGTLRKNGSVDPGSTINYSTGAIIIAGRAGDTINANFSYYPLLPVLGEEDLVLQGSQFPGTLAFDTTYSYNIQTASPNNSYDVSFYKNPATATYSGYVQKTTWTPVTWNGQDYQQFWSTNYLGAFWVTNGITVPFTTTNIGMQFKPIVTVTVTSTTTASLQITGHGLVVGDFVFINEVATTTGINFQTGYVTTVTNSNNVIVTFPNASLASNGTGGIAQYLTSNVANPTLDCLRYYDGDPTNGSSTSPVLTAGKGWVNFSPPLSQNAYSIADLPAAQYYLVGARMIFPFKDRLLFFGPVIQTSSGSPIYLQDTVIYSQNGTPYYTASWNGNVFNPTTGFQPILVPTNQTATPSAYWEDQTGFGGFTTAGIDNAIVSVNTNEDALIVGFDPNIQTRLIYTGTDLFPFNFFIINAEYGSSSTFSAINMDAGVISKGNRAYIIASQTEVRRIDLEIPDEVFETRLTQNGTERVTAQRDFINEWIYFSYPASSENATIYKFPTQTLQFNYRDNSWGLFYESYTTYGSFRQQTGFTWATVGSYYSSWSAWNDPWNSGQSELLQPQVIGGNQQGFVLVRGVGTSEGTSLAIQNMVTNTVTCINHCLNQADFILITGCLGTVGNVVNNEIFQIQVIDVNTFTINQPQNLTYLGGGLITRIYIPVIQTKQFPLAWDLARKTRIGAQQYLFTTTSNSQITLQIYLSQNGDSPYNSNVIIPPTSPNNALIYSNILYTCPESTNLGLTPSNVNLQMPTASQQAQIWHRMNTSLIGDTVQIGFTLSDEQVIENELLPIPITITGATQANPCVLTCNGPFSVESGAIVEINGIVGMTQLNGNTYSVLSVSNQSSSSGTISIAVNSTAFSAYVSGGTVTQIAANPFAEIELHGFILDVQPSQVLA